MTDTVDSLKQRLVGAFVIVTLAIIFLPMIFDKPHQQGNVVVVPVPPKPEYKTIEITKPVPPSFNDIEEDRALAKLEKEVVEPLSTDTGTKHKEKAVRSKVLPSTTSQVKPTSKKIEADQSARKQSNKNSSSKSKPSVAHLAIFKNVWMVQLGIFSNVKNAYKLRDKLRKDGFDGHTKVITLSGKKAVKVFSGPFVKKRDAIKTKKRLDKKYKVDSRVVFFDA